MKFIFLSTLFIATALQASELKSQKIKQDICLKLSRDYKYQVSKDACLNTANFDIKSAKKIEFDQKKYTTQMDIHVDLKKSLYLVTVFRNITTYPFELGSWQVVITGFTLSDYHLVKKASVYDANVVELKNSSDIKAIPKAVLAFEGDSEFQSAKDYVSKITYYLILNDNDRAIGYIAYQWFESEEADIKGYTTQNFDLSGNTVGEMGYESFNYYE